jgi:hypothetical protein
VDLLGPHLLVADPQGFGKTGKKGKLAVLRVLDDAGQKLLPAQQWTLAGEVASDELAGANRVKVAGQFAFVGGSRGGKGGHFAVVDLSDPRQPHQAAALPFSDSFGPNGLAVAGKVVFLAGGQTIEAIDVSDPRKPERIAAQRLVEAFPTPEAKGNAHDLVYRNGLLYVTGQTDHCLAILRVQSERLRRLAER